MIKKNLIIIFNLPQMIKSKQDNFLKLAYLFLNLLPISQFQPYSRK